MVFASVQRLSILMTGGEHDYGMQAVCVCTFLGALRLHLDLVTPTRLFGAGGGDPAVSFMRLPQSGCLAVR